MIQRPQSIWLAVSIIALFTVILAPIWTKKVMAYGVYAWCFARKIPAGGGEYGSYFPYTLIALFSLTAVCIATYELFRYDNRAVQLKLGTLNTLVMVMLLGWILYLTIQKETNAFHSASGQDWLSFLWTVVALVSNLLANHYISKDERLVKNADRIR